MRFIGTMKDRLEFGGLVKLHQLRTEVLINACRCCFPQAENIKYTRTHAKLTRRFEHANISYYRYEKVNIKTNTYIYIYAYDICLYYITYITIFKHIYIYYIYTRFQHVLIVLILPISSGGVGRSTRLIKVSLCFFSSLGCGFRWVWVKDLFFFGGGNLWDRLIFVKRNLRKMSRKSTLAAIHAWRIGPHGGRIRG